MGGEARPGLVLSLPCLAGYSLPLRGVPPERNLAATGRRGTAGAADETGGSTDERPGSLKRAIARGNGDFQVVHARACS
jgi:hypothetical protein